MVVPPLLPKSPDSTQKPCSDGAAAVRLQKALHFQTVAALIDQDLEAADAYLFLCINAGIAAADAICCHVFGHYIQSTDHSRTLRELENVGDRKATQALRGLLRIRSRDASGHANISVDDRNQAGLQMNSLIESARNLGVS